MPDESTLEHLGAGPGPFDLVVTSAADVWAGGVEAAARLMRAGAVYDTWQGRGSPSRAGAPLARVIFGRLLLVRGYCATRARRAGAERARPSVQEGRARPVRAGLKMYRDFSRSAWTPQADSGRRVRCTIGP